MNAAAPLSPPSPALSRDRLLAATAQASRLLLESSDVMLSLPEVLRVVGEAAGVDRTTLALADTDATGQRWLEVKSQWKAPGVADDPESGAGKRRVDCYCSELSAGRSVYLCGTNALQFSCISGDEAKSSIIVPVMIHGEYAGAVGFDTLQTERKYDPAVISALEIAASVVGAALQHERLLETMRRERETAAEQRVAELARANAALRANLTRLADQPAEFFSHLLLAAARLTSADAASVIIAGYDSDQWQVSCHYGEGRISDAPFADSVPGPGSRFICQMTALREPLHLDLDDGSPPPDWPAFIDFHRAAGLHSIFLLPLVFGEGSIGVVSLGFRQYEPIAVEVSELLVAFGQQATLGLAMKRLVVSYHQSVMLAERNRLGREIHDGLAQAFTGILMQLGAAEEQAEGSPLANVMNRVRDIAREGLAEARRSVLALRPEEEPRPGGLELALRQLAERSTVADRIATTFHGGGATGLPPEHEHALLRIAQEAVINAARHAEPRNIEIHLENDGDHVLMCVRDDGRGMQLPELYAQQGFGLTNMRERAEDLGGTLQIASAAGEGTRVSVRMPRPAAKTRA